MSPALGISLYNTWAFLHVLLCSQRLAWLGLYVVLFSNPSLVLFVGRYLSL